MMIADAATATYTDIPESVHVLVLARDAAALNWFTHYDPGGLRPAEKKAWKLEDRALFLLLRAAQTRLNAELNIKNLLRYEES